MGFWSKIRSRFTRKKPQKSGGDSSSIQSGGGSVPKPSDKPKEMGSVSNVSASSKSSLSTVVRASSGGGGGGGSSSSSNNNLLKNVNAVSTTVNPSMESVKPGQTIPLGAGDSSKLQPSTSVTQVKNNKPKIDTNIPLSQQGGAELGYAGATKATIENYGRGIKQWVTGKPQGYKEDANYYDYAGGLKADKVAYTTPVFGTVGDKGSFEKTTYRDIQEDIDFNRAVIKMGVDNKAKESQRKIDAGEDFDIVSQEFSDYVDESNKKYSSYTDVEDLTTRSGGNIPKYAEVGTDIVVGVGGGLVNPAIPVAYFGAKGLGQITKTPSKEDAFADINLAWDNTLGGESKDTPLFTEYKDLRKEGAINLGFAGVSAVSTPFRIGNEITALRYTEGMASKSFTKSNIIGSLTDDEFKVLGRSYKQTPSFELNTKFQSNVIPNADGTYSLGGGYGRTTTRTLDFMKQGTGAYEWRVSSKPFTFTGSQIPQVGSSNTQTFTGNMLINQDDTIKNVRYGGVSLINEKGTSSLSGEINKLRMYPVSGKRTAIASIQDVGFSKDKRFLGGLSDLGDDLGSSFSSSGKSNKLFSQNLQVIKSPQNFEFGGANSLQGATSVKPITQTKFTFGASGSSKSSQQVITQDTTISKASFTPVQVSSGNILESQTRRVRRSGSANLLSVSVKQSPVPKQKPFTNVGFNQIPTQKQPTKLGGAVTSGFGGGAGVGGAVTSGFGGGGLPFIGLPFGSERPKLGYRKLGGKQSFRYTPSFKAIAFNIKGKSPKKTKFTGLELRPIVEGELFGKRQKKQGELFKQFKF